MRVFGCEQEGPLLGNEAKREVFGGWKLGLEIGQNQCGLDAGRTNYLASYANHSF